MNMLRRWLRNGFASNATSADRRNPRRRVQPALERLEDRCTPAVTFHGGVTLPHVEVESLFYGANWYNNSTLYQDTGYLNGFLQTITNSSYMDMLTQAGYNVGRGQSLDGPISLANVPGSVDDSQIQSVLQGYSATASCNRRTAIVCFRVRRAERRGDGRRGEQREQLPGLPFRLPRPRRLGADGGDQLRRHPVSRRPQRGFQSLSALQGVTEVSSPRAVGGGHGPGAERHQGVVRRRLRQCTSG